MIRFLSEVAPVKLKGTALLRLDFNTEDEWRMAATLPTVKLLARHADKVIIVSHRGRPDAKRVAKLSLRKDAARLQKLLRRPVTFISRFRLQEIKAKVAAAPRHSIFLLENIRFAKGETENDPKFAQVLASIADYFVNDCFAVNHRKAASTVGVAKLLPSYAGLELEKEIKFLSQVVKKPKKPLVLVTGGAKAHDKLGVIEQFRNRAAAILVGGGSANTLLYLKGVDIGESLFDSDKKDLAALRRVVGYKNVFMPTDWKKEKGKILDIGPETAKLFAQKISKARTVIWSGPMGLIERKKFEKGNLAVAKAIAANRRAFTLTGGGETVAFLKRHKLDKKFSFISTGGGAFLEFLAGDKLPGIEALKK